MTGCCIRNGPPDRIELTLQKKRPTPNRGKGAFPCLLPRLGSCLAVHEGKSCKDTLPRRGAHYSQTVEEVNPEPWQSATGKQAWPPTRLHAPHKPRRQPSLPLKPTQRKCVVKTSNPLLALQLKLRTRPSNGSGTRRSGGLHPVRVEACPVSACCGASHRPKQSGPPKKMAGCPRQMVMANATDGTVRSNLDR